jgi:hypothetical protein
LQPPGVAAELRRRQNPDLREAGFRSMLPSLLERFEELTPQPWQSFNELLRIVYGYDFPSLHGDVQVDRDMEKQFHNLLKSRHCQPEDSSSSHQASLLFMQSSLELELEIKTIVL